jgi:D-alanine-D-alanine ligase
MRIAVLHGAVPEGASRDEQDVLVEAEAVGAALRRLGHEPCPLVFSLDLQGFRAELERVAPDAVFNLVESVEGRGRLIHVAPGLLDALGVPYTGAPTDAQFCASNKLVSKQMLAGAGIPTPHWHAADGRSGGEPTGDGQALGATPTPGPTRYIIKSVWEHASVGLDEDSVVTPRDAAELEREIARRSGGLAGECFAEAFVDGREFNIALLAGPDGVEVLPAAEIRFDAYPEGKHRVVGYRAKWDDDSFEYHHTTRHHDFPGEEELLATLAAIARRCWELFGLRGYARVDFRLDESARPWVLEVNTNPCISPDAGFVAAATRAGLTLDQVVSRILDDVPGLLRTTPKCT